MERQDGVGALASARGVVDGTGAVATRGGAGTAAVEDPEEEERRQIDAENRARIAAMSPEEIERERAELVAGLDPKLVRMLMGRGEEKAKAKEPMVSDAEMVHRMKGDLTKDGGGKDGGRDGGKKEIGLED